MTLDAPNQNNSLAPSFVGRTRHMHEHEPAFAHSRAPNWKRNACSVVQLSWPRKSHSLTLIWLEWKISWEREGERGRGREGEREHRDRRRANVCGPTRDDWLTTCGTWDMNTDILCLTCPKEMSLSLQTSYGFHGQERAHRTTRNNLSRKSSCQFDVQLAPSKVTMEMIEWRRISSLSVLINI